MILRSAPAGMALVTAALALFGALWIVVPAPARLLAFVAVGASEWSLWLAGAALAGVGLALLSARLGASRGWITASVVAMGLSATGLAIVPLAQALVVAEANGIRLRPWRALMGTPDEFRGTVQTVAFASGDGDELQMDVYLPQAAGFVHGPGDGGTLGADQGVGTRPAVIVVHGGSWSGGFRSEFPRWNRWLSSHGYVVFDIDYRLRPQPNWQTATGDVKCAVGVVQRDAAWWGIDPDRVVPLGRSAGAHLALLAAYSTGDAVLRPSCAVGDTGVSAVIALYGPTDLVWGYDHPVNPRVNDGRDVLRRFIGGRPDVAGAQYRRASPITHVRRSTPPTLLLHGGRDQYVRVQHTIRLSARLREAGVPHQAIILPYAQHGFDFVFDGWGGQITQAAALAFLQRR